MTCMTTITIIDDAEDHDGETIVLDAELQVHHVADPGCGVVGGMGAGHG